jgi:hypothetical protein
MTKLLFAASAGVSRPVHACGMPHASHRAPRIHKLNQLLTILTGEISQ